MIAFKTIIALAQRAKKKNKVLLLKTEKTLYHVYQDEKMGTNTIFYFSIAGEKNRDELLFENYFSRATKADLLLFLDQPINSEFITKILTGTLQILE